MNNERPLADTEPAESSTLWDRLWAPCDVASVALFRVVFALVVLGHVILYFSSDSVRYYFGKPAYHLSYFGFEWVRAFDLEGMRRVYFLMALAAVGVGLGCLYRISATLLFITFTYTFLAEAAQFQNHYYLISLVAFLLILIPAHRSFSIDAVLVPHRARSFIPNWCRWLLMFQIAIPYAYGGIAKLNGDWLNAMPAVLWFPQKAHLPVIGPWLADPSAAWFISHFGLVFDLAIVPLLLWKRTRIWAYVMVVAFHLSNAVLFNIDVFPWMMIPATTILFSPGWPRRFLRLDHPIVEGSDVPSKKKRTLSQRLTIGFVTAYIVWQTLFPLRHFCYPGDPSWTDEGQQFAWRMMLRDKRVFFIFYATDGATGRMIEIPLPRLMTPRQLHELSLSPDQIVACAPFLAEWARREQGFRDVEIRAFVLTSLNGRKAQLQIDPDLDLLTVHRSILPQPGIVPLTEPRRDVPWDVPVPRWSQVLGIAPPVSVPVTD